MTNKTELKILKLFFIEDDSCSIAYNHLKPSVDEIMT